MAASDTLKRTLEDRLGYGVGKEVGELLDAVDELSSAEAGFLDGVTAGTATASKALVLGASKEIATVTSATITTATIPNFVGAESHAGVITPVAGVAAAGGFTATPAGLLNTQGYVPIVNTYGTDTTPTTTSVYVTEIFVPCNMTLVGVTYLNGSAVTNGTVRIGLYTSAGVAIAGALTAATATAGIDSYQKVPFAVAYEAVGPARYLIGFQWSSATDRFNCHPFGSAAYSIVQASATVGTTTISPLPTAFVTGAAVVASLY